MKSSIILFSDHLPSLQPIYSLDAHINLCSTANNVMRNLPAYATSCTIALGDPFIPTIRITKLSKYVGNRA